MRMPTNAVTRRHIKDISDDEFVDAFAKCMFNNTATAKMLGISSGSYYRLLQDRPGLGQRLQLERRGMADIAQSALMEILKDPEHKDYVKVAIFMAQAHDRETYGAQTKVDVTTQVKIDVNPLLAEIAKKHFPPVIDAVVVDDNEDFLK